MTALQRMMALISLDQQRLQRAPHVHLAQTHIQSDN